MGTEPSAVGRNRREMKGQTLFVALLLAASSAAQQTEPTESTEPTEPTESTEEPEATTVIPEVEVEPRFTSSLWNKNKFYGAPLRAPASPFEALDTFPTYARPLTPYRLSGGSYRPYKAVAKPYFFSRVRRPVYVYRPVIIRDNAVVVDSVQVDDVVIEPISDAVKVDDIRSS